MPKTSSLPRQGSSPIIDIISVSSNIGSHAKLVHELLKIPEWLPLPSELYRRILDFSIFYTAGCEWTQKWNPLLYQSGNQSVSGAELKINRHAEIVTPSKDLNIITDRGAKNLVHFNAFKTQLFCSYAKTWERFLYQSMVKQWNFKIFAYSLVLISPTTWSHKVRFWTLRLLLEKSVVHDQITILFFGLKCFSSFWGAVTPNTLILFTQSKNYSF